MPALTPRPSFHGARAPRPFTSRWSNGGLSTAVLATLSGTLAVGLLLAALRIHANRAPMEQWPRVLLACTLIAAGWIPIVPFVGRSWRWFERRRRFVVSQLTGIAVAVLIQPLWVALVVRLAGGEAAPYPVQLFVWLDTTTVIYAAVLTGWWVAHQRRRADAAQLAVVRLKTLAADARLQVLTLQLQPHFIFNTLNLVSQLAYRDAGGAVAAIGDLRSLLTESSRHTFHRETSLRDELRFTKAYLDIQRRRFRDRLSVMLDADDASLCAAVPHLVLQPLVENAIVHGLAARARGGSVRVSARRAGDRLLLEVVDDGVGFTAPLSAEGLGLTNTRLRLQQLYRDDYRFTIEPLPEGGARTRAIIPFRELAADTPPAAASVDEDAADGWPSARHEPSHADPALHLPSLGVVAVAWAMIALAWTQMDFVAPLLGARRAPWLVMAELNVIGAAFWTLLTPCIAWIARRVDLTERCSCAGVATHLGAAITVATLHVYVTMGLSRLFVGEFVSGLRADNRPWFAWNMLVYFSIIALAAVARLGARRQSRLVAADVAREHLQQARAATLRLRLQPQLLVQSLDALAVAVARNAKRAERGLARMGDLLRLLLEAAPDDFAILDDELTLLEAYADVSRVAMPSDGGDVTNGPTCVVAAVRRRGVVAAVSLAPMAAALGGFVTDITVAGERGGLSVEIATIGGSPSPERFGELRARLASTYGHEVALHYESLPHARSIVRCLLPTRSVERLHHDRRLAAESEPVSA